MNALTSAIVWMSVQVLLFSLVGGAAYVLMRRRGPVAAVACAALVLSLTLPLVLLMASPWPRWIGKSEISILKSHSNSNHRIRNEEDTAGAPKADSEMAVDAPDASPTVLSWWRTAVNWYLTGGDFAAADVAKPQAAWVRWIPWVLVAGLGLGLLRLAAGVWAVGGLRRCSQRIEDAGLLQELDQLKKQMLHPYPALSHGERLLQSKRIEIRQSSLLRSAATVGWRRPILLLPADWESWTGNQRRVVLAHELAHVARQDYLTGLLARLAAAIHFYQPLVLWLGRQLHIEQELAADSQAAAVAGGQQTYLATLAQLALQADEQSLPWAARAFLPGTSMLIKRVAWLKRKGPLVERSLSRGCRWILAASMIAVAVAVAGIRGPNDGGISQLMAAAPEDQTAKPQADGGQSGEKRDAGPTSGNSQKVLRSFAYVPADAKLIVGIDPHELAKIAPGSKPFIDKLDAEFQSKNRFKLTDVTDLELIWTSSTKRPNRIVIQTEKPVGWKDVLRNHNPDYLETRHVGEHEYFVWKDSSDIGPCFYMVDERTVVAGSDEEIQKVIRGGEKLMDPNVFQEFPASPLAIRAEMSILKSMAGLDKLPNDFAKNPAAAMFLPLIEHVKVERGFAGSGSPSATGASQPVGFHALLECDSADGAQQVAKTLDALRTVGLNLLQAKMQALQQSAPPTAHQEEMAQVKGIFDILTKSLTDAKIRATDKVAEVSANVDLGPALVAGFMMPAMAAAKEASLRTESMSNLKQLAVAMYNFETKNKHFPAAAVLGPDGKTKHSWRVAILPFLGMPEAAAVFKEYRMDEPWDSEHNKKLIDKMPAVFRDPHEDANSTNPCYFMPTGKGMFGGNEEGWKIREITDGTSMTVMLVEAKRDNPWTKPEDIEIDPDPTKPLPEFGGHLTTNNFLAAFVDGHVEVLGKDIEPRLLHAMFTIAGREIISFPSNASAAQSANSAMLLSPGDSGPMHVFNHNSDADRIKIEFHRAEKQPTAGLTEATAPDGRNVKIYLHPEAELTNADIAKATATTDSLGQPAVSVSFTAQGSEKMAKLTEENLGKPMVIMVDGKVLGAPTIRSKIADGKAQITGNFTQEEAERIAKGINGK